jgi:hypothetical protein
VRQTPEGSYRILYNLQATTSHPAGGRLRRICHPVGWRAALRPPAAPPDENPAGSYDLPNRPPIDARQRRFVATKIRARPPNTRRVRLSRPTPRQAFRLPTPDKPCAGSIRQRAPLDPMSGAAAAPKRKKHGRRAAEYQSIGRCAAARAPGANLGGARRSQPLSAASMSAVSPLFWRSSPPTQRRAA